MGAFSFRPGRFRRAEAIHCQPAPRRARWLDDKIQPAANLSGLEVSVIEAEQDGVISLDPELAAIWELGAPLLKVRGNDAHSLYAFGLARALLDAHPKADAAVVLPAIMLHDIGWSQVPPAEVLQAIAPGGGRPDLVLLHDKEGARLAAGILADAGYDAGPHPYRPPPRSDRTVRSAA